ncbi:MAG: sensor histidine kinase, partial [Terrimicrobiaceae bacterium]|nr:sensor histidine kinase [Terrimicrobiaceae bacterium]
VEAEGAIAESEKRLRQLSARLLASQEEERRRIARELHDSTAQSLAALEMHVSLLEPLARAARSRRLVAETRAIARNCCQELRNISYLLHPPLLEEVGLPFAIRWLADGFAARSGISMTVDIAPDFPRLEPDAEAALFRVVQEASSNIYRHSGASSARLRLELEGQGWVVLSISDNGHGFPPSENRPPGIGLAGMRERLGPLGGELSIENSARGVTITARLPLRSAHAQSAAQTHTYR